MTISDEQIKKDVVDQLYWDQAVNASGLVVKVDSRNVELQGGVPSFSARRAAYTAATMIPGVRSVDNALQVSVPPGAPSVSDGEIKSRVEKTLAWNASIDATNVAVLVSEGHVTLDGDVDAYWKKVRALELVADLTGVRDVEDALSVVPTERPKDEEIASDIMSALKRRVDLNVDQVDVTVNDGLVTLSGTVPDWSTSEDVGRTARYTAGVLGVVNALGVPTAQGPAQR